jgi:hypothetical protein
MGFEPEPSKEGSWMMAQNDLVVVGIDVAKDKVDGCIRSLSLRQTSPSTALGRRKLVEWLCKHGVSKAVMEASGGYERGWAKALREAGIEVRIVDPKRVRSFAKSAGRLAKNDTIDAQMIAWFAETFCEAPGQSYDAAREELQKTGKRAPGTARNPDENPKQRRACCAGTGAENACQAAEEDRHRTGPARGCDRCHD